jgi:hypothetical protein
MLALLRGLVEVTVFLRSFSYNDESGDFLLRDHLLRGLLLGWNGDLMS